MAVSGLGKQSSVKEATTATAFRVMPEEPAWRERRTAFEGDEKKESIPRTSEAAGVVVFGRLAPVATGDADVGCSI